MKRFSKDVVKVRVKFKNNVVVDFVTGDPLLVIWPDEDSLTPIDYEITLPLRFYWVYEGGRPHFHPVSWVVYKDEKTLLDDIANWKSPLNNAGGIACNVYLKDEASILIRCAPGYGYAGLFVNDIGYEVQDYIKREIAKKEVRWLNENIL